MHCHLLGGSILSARRMSPKGHSAIAHCSFAAAGAPGKECCVDITPLCILQDLIWSYSLHSIGIKEDPRLSRGQRPGTPGCTSSPIEASCCSNLLR